MATEVFGVLRGANGTEDGTMLIDDFEAVLTFGAGCLDVEFEPEAFGVTIGDDEGVVAVENEGVVV